MRNFSCQGYGMKNYSRPFNALRVTVFGDLEPVYIEDFSCYEGLSVPIGFGCRRINIVSTEEMKTLSGRIGFTVVGYVDADGYDKNFIPNRLMQAISGYNLLMGPAIICGWADNDYAPLPTKDVEILTRFCISQYGIAPKKAQGMLQAFREVGQDEYDEGLKRSREGKPLEAHALFVKSAELGYRDGINALAMDYMWGDGVEVDEAKGLELLRKAYDASSAKAARNLGLSYKDGDHGLPVDYEKARAYLTAGALLSDAQAAAWLGYMYLDADFGFRNTAKAAYWIQAATDVDSDVGWFMLGLLIADDEYYCSYPAYVRYCFEQYVKQDNDNTLEEVLDTTFSNKDFVASILAAESLKPDYPPVPDFVRSRDFPDPCEALLTFEELLAHRETVEEARELLLLMADTGYSQACSVAALLMVDAGQGDEFVVDKATGKVTAFPADDDRAMRYMETAARNGNRYCMCMFPLFGLPFIDGRSESEIRTYIKRYIALFGDWVMETYILPHLSKLIPKIVNEGYFMPWQYHEDFEEAEAAVKHLYAEDMTLDARVDALEKARNAENGEAVDRLLEYYRYIIGIET